MTTRPAPIDAAADAASILRVPPHSLEAEQAVIGAMVLRGTFCAATRALSPSDFYNANHADLWAFIQSCVTKDGAVDQLLVRDELAAAPRYRDIDPSTLIDILAECVRTVDSPANAGLYAQIVRKKAALRRIIYATETIRSGALDGEDPAELAARLKLIGDAERTAAVERSGTAEWPWETDSSMASSRTELSWVLRGFLARGAVSLLVGQPKAGKSWWVYALLAAMERGDAEFCGYALHGARAVVLSEEPPATILGKRRRFGGTEDGAVFLTRTAAFPPRPLQDVVAEAARKAAEIGAEVLIVDTWAIWAHLGADAEKDAGATQKALEPLLWAAGQGLAVLVVHHMKKADGEDGTSVRGSSALLGTVDILIELRRFGAGGDDEDPTASTRGGKRTLKTYGRYEECPDEVVIELQGDRFASLGTAKTARVASLADKVVAAVVDAPHPMTFPELAGVLGVSTSGGRAKAGLLAALRLATDAGRIQTWSGDGSRWHPTRYAPPGAIQPTPPESPR